MKKGQISREEHFLSIEKWKDEIIPRTEKGMKFSSELFNPGFEDGFVVWQSCSYCEYYYIVERAIYDDPCRICPMHQYSIYGTRACALGYKDFSSAGNFVRLMLAGKNKEALPHAWKVVERLNELTIEFGYDKPEKK